MTFRVKVRDNSERDGDSEGRWEQKRSGVRDGRLSVLMGFGGLLLLFHIAVFLYSSIAGSGSFDPPCKELRVVDGENLRVLPCRDTAKSFTAANIPANFTPFFFQPVKINYADREMLMTVKGIGPSLASRIIAYRKSSGPFQNIEDLLNVKGVGGKRGAALASQLNFDDIP
ncbi:MAG: ComEA family DNA-binding protein [Desulforhopalus sp.]